MSRDPAHDAKMAAVRNKHAKSNGTGGRVDVPGGMAGLAKRMAEANAPVGRPWTRAEYWDHEWRGDEYELAGLLAEELLYEYDVEDVDAQVVATSTTVENYLDRVNEALGARLDAMVASGRMTASQQERVLDRFNESTRDAVAQRMAPHLLPFLHERAHEFQFHEDE